jgi:hypothetical protein
MHAFGIFVGNQMDVATWAYFHIFYCVALVYMFVFCAGTMLFCLLQLCSIVWRQVLSILTQNGSRILISDLKL